MRHQPRIQHLADDLGRSIVRVEIVNLRGVYAIVDQDDFERLAADGHSMRWFLNENGAGAHYVRCLAPDFIGRVETVARLVMQAESGVGVRYASGDRLDLRKSNLRLAAHNRARGQTRSADEFAPDLRAKPDSLVIPPPPIADQPRPSGTMGTPEPTSGYAFAPL